MYSQYPIRDLIVVNAEATEANVKTFLTGASPLEARVLTGDGKAVPTTKGNFKIFAKHSDNTLKVSEVIDADKVVDITKTAPRTKVPKAYEITIPDTVATGTVMEIKVVLDNWGSLSFDDQYFKYGFAQKSAADATEDLANRLITSLSKSFEREYPEMGTSTIVDNYITAKSVFANEAAVVSGKAGLTDGETIQVTAGAGKKAYKVADKTGATFAAIATLLGDVKEMVLPNNGLFTFVKTSTAGVIKIKITEKDQPFYPGKKQGRHLVFNVSNDFDGPTVLTERVINPNDAKFIRSLEWFCKGNTGDLYREVGYPYNIDPAEADTSLSATYYVINMNYYNGDGPAHNVQKSPRGLQIAIANKAEANKLITDIEAATGLTIGAFA